MTVLASKIYICDKCKKEWDTKISGQPRGWFKLVIKCFSGCDKKNTHEYEICGFECAHKIMIEHKNSICINWVKMKVISF